MGWLLGCLAENALPMGSSAQDCASCHPDQVAAWEPSPHGRGSAVFDALLPYVEEDWGDFARQTCESCHRPGHSEDANIGCVSCHAAMGNHGESDGRLAVDLGAPLAGSLGAESVATLAHTSEVRGFLQSESLCGTCHEVTGPELFVEQTLSEFRDAPAYAEGKTCQSCHMPALSEGPWVPEGPKRPRVDHGTPGFTAANLADALEVMVMGDRVRLQNTGAGHAIPTGVSFFRRISLVAWGENTSQTLLVLGATPVHAGQPTLLVTEASAIEDHRLFPGQSQEAELPPGTQKIQLVAERFPADLLEFLGQSEAPVVVGEWEVPDK